MNFKEKITSRKNRRKYTKLNRYKNLYDFIKDIMDMQYVFLYDKPLHPSFVLSMQLRTIKHYIYKGAFYVAEQTRRINV